MRNIAIVDVPGRRGRERKKTLSVHFIRIQSNIDAFILKRKHGRDVGAVAESEGGAK